MSPDPKFPAWLVFTERAPDENSLLRMLILNPFNNAMSVFINRVVDGDPAGYLPGPDQIHTASAPLRGSKTPDLS